MKFVNPKNDVAFKKYLVMRIRRKFLFRSLMRF